MEKSQYAHFFSLPYRPLNENVSSRAMMGKELMFVEHKVKKGHLAENDQHENEQLTLVMHGSIRMTIDNVTHLLKAGDAVIILSGVVHTCEVLEDSSVLEVFSPPRKEWIAKLHP